MKNTMYTLVALIFTLSVAAQDYLNVVANDGAISYFYPKGTTFKLYDNSGATIDTGGREKIELSGEYVVEVFTKWNATPDIIPNEKGALKIYLKPHPNMYPHFENDKTQQAKSNKYGRYKGPVKANKILVRSTENPERYNAIVQFSNGIQFEYSDGRTKATLDNKELAIEGKYIIESELGILKLSYNPKDGKIWYVFE